MLKNLSSTWDLDSYFPGGSNSVEFVSYLGKIQNQIKDFQSKLANIDNTLCSTWKYVIDEVQDISKKLRHARSFTSCLAAQNTQDKKAIQLSGTLNSLNALFADLMNVIEERLLKLSDSDFNGLLEDEYFAPLEFNLTEIRVKASKKLSADKESIVNALSVDGYHAWNTLYSSISGSLKIPVDINGELMKLSPGQAANMMSSPKREVREKVFTSWETAWSKVADNCALALNSIAGFRLNLYQQRGWDDFLSEPLEYNRMSRKTIDTMWSTINKNKKPLVQFLKRKKKILHIDRLSWHDYTAPISSISKTYSLEDGANFVVKHISNFSKSMGALVTKAFHERWVETENRDNKRAGAFCSSSPVSKQSRVFMTYSGTSRNINTLAHELGHAYHSSVMADLPPLSQSYAMNVAETASTFSEFVVSDASLAAAKTKEERIALLSADLRRAVSLLMNIQSRYLFETRFYEKRKSGFVSVPELNKIMLTAQKEAFSNALDVYHPHFWASKLHFYITRIPFYNFPYTFGYLFSAGVYANAKNIGNRFEQNYINLLRDTGRMKVEDLAKKYLNVDLESKEFWQDALNVVLGGYTEFMELTK